MQQAGVLEAMPGLEHTPHRLEPRLHRRRRETIRHASGRRQPGEVETVPVDAREPRRGGALKPLLHFAARGVSERLDDDGAALELKHAAAVVHHLQVERLPGGRAKARQEDLYRRLRG